MESPSPFPLVIAMVGLPARGKSSIAKQLIRYLNWIGVSVKLFNVGDYRRQADNTSADKSFFSSENQEAQLLRNELAKTALVDMCQSLKIGQHQLAIFDATNTTKSRRSMVYDYVVQQYGFKLIFLESYCNDPAIVEANVRNAKLSNADYKEMDPVKAFEDFMARIRCYEQVYEQLDVVEEQHCSFIKIVNGGVQIELNRVNGLFQERIANYLSCLSIKPKTIYITRNAKCESNLLAQLSGSPKLSYQGQEYSLKLSKHFKYIPNIQIWTSEDHRSIQTVQSIHADKIKHRNELNFKFVESFDNLVQRLEPIVQQLERITTEYVLLVAHQSILVTLLEYFLGQDSRVSIPWHTLFKLIQTEYGWKIEIIDLID